MIAIRKQMIPITTSNSGKENPHTPQCCVRNCEPIERIRCTGRPATSQSSTAPPVKERRRYLLLPSRRAPGINTIATLGCGRQQLPHIVRISPPGSSRKRFFRKLYRTKPIGVLNPLYIIGICSVGQDRVVLLLLLCQASLDGWHGCVSRVQAAGIHGRHGRATHQRNMDRTLPPGARWLYDQVDEPAFHDNRALKRLAGHFFRNNRTLQRGGNHLFV